MEIAVGKQPYCANHAIIAYNFFEFSKQFYFCIFWTKEADQYVREMCAAALSL